MHPRTCWLLRHRKKYLLDLQFWLSKVQISVPVFWSQHTKPRNTFFADSRIFIPRSLERSICSMYGRGRFTEMVETYKPHCHHIRRTLSTPNCNSSHSHATKALHHGGEGYLLQTPADKENCDKSFTIGIYQVSLLWHSLSTHGHCNHDDNFLCSYHS